MALLLYMFLFSCGAKPDRTKKSRSLRAGFVLCQTLRGAETSAANDIPHLVCFIIISPIFLKIILMIRISILLPDLRPLRYGCGTGGKVKPCSHWNYRVFTFEVAGFEPAAFWSRNIGTKIRLPKTFIYPYGIISCNSCTFCKSDFSYIICTYGP